MNLNRRDFSNGLLGAGLAGVLPAVSSPAGRGRTEGVHYVRLAEAAPAAAGGKIEVIEFFWYECPHCHAFEPALEAWARSSPRRRVPARSRLVPGGAVQRPAAPVLYPGGARSRADDPSQGLPGDPRRAHALAQRRGPGRLRAQERSRPDPVHDHLQLVRRAVEVASRRARPAYKIDAVPAMGIHGRYYTNGNLANAGSQGSIDRSCSGWSTRSSPRCGRAVAPAQNAVRHREVPRRQ